MDKIFNPSSVVVIGASTNTAKAGYRILKNIKNSSFKGKLYGVNKNDSSFYSSILDVKDEIDLVVIVIPKKDVVNVVTECVEKKVKSIVIIAGGFKESGDIDSENKIKDLIKDTDIKVVGPNSCGVLSSSINASFSKNENIKEGNLFLVTQSGAILTSLIDFSAENNLGIRKAISLGNKMDISEIDILDHIEEDDCLCFYLESIDNFKEFMDNFGKIKNPKFILSPGKSNKSQVEIQSHTGAIVSDRDILSLALRKNNILELTSLEDLFDVSKIFANLKYNNIKGTRLAIVTNAGGMAILATDCMEGSQISFAELSQETKDKLEKYFSGRKVSNPIDILGDAQSQRYRDVLDILKDDENIDIVMVIITPQASTDIDEIANVINDFSLTCSEKFVISVFTGGFYAQKAINFLTNLQIPSYSFPERAINALNYLDKFIHGKSIKYENNLKIDKKEIISIIDSNNKGKILGFEDSVNILEKFNIKFPKFRVIENIEDLEKSVLNIGYPLTLKVEDKDIPHKSDKKGVINNIQNYEDLLSSYRRLQSLSSRVLMQEYIDSTFEIMTGVIRYEGIGSVIVLGTGGILTEILDDHIKEYLPINEEEALNLLRKTKFYPLLHGFRGLEKYKESDIINVLMGLSYLIENIPQISQIDINPIILTKKGDILTVDPKIYLCV